MESIIKWSEKAWMQRKEHHLDTDSKRGASLRLKIEQWMRGKKMGENRMSKPMSYLSILICPLIRMVNASDPKANLHV